MKIKNSSQFGKVKNDFSERFSIPQNGTEIFDDTILGIKLIPKNFATTTMLKFKWKLLSFDTTSMEIQLTFESPIFVSSDTYGRDILSIKILQPDFFMSELSHKSVEKGISLKSEVP